MSFAKKLNKVVFKYDAKGKDFVKLGDLVRGKVYQIKAVFINKKSKFGPSPVIGLDTCLVDLPAHCLDDVEAILADPEIIDSINEGKAGFSVVTYEDKNGITRYSVNWEDIE